MKGKILARHGNHVASGPMNTPIEIKNDPTHSTIYRYGLDGDEHHHHMVEFCDFDHKPSWQRFGDGSGSFAVDGFYDPKWLQLAMKEHGEKITRTTYATLTRAQIVLLRDFLNKLLREKP